MDTLKKESSTQQADLDLKSTSMARKDSDLFKTRERLNKLEGDYAQMRDAYKTLKAESEERLFTLDRQRKTDTQSRGDIEGQVAKLRDLLT